MARPTLDTLDATAVDRKIITNFRRLRDYAGDLEVLATDLQTQVLGLPRPLTGAEIQALVQPQIVAQIDAALSGGAGGSSGTFATAVAFSGIAPGPANTRLIVAHPGGFPPTPDLRFLRANFCGVRVPGLPPVPGSAADPTLLITGLYGRYAPADRAAIRAAYVARGYTHFPLSWADARAVGTSVATYVTQAQELAAAGLLVGHVWCGVQPDFGVSTATIMAAVTPVITALQLAGGVLAWSCVGRELSRWRTPVEVQALIDQQAALLVPGSTLYVQLQPDVFAYPQTGLTMGDFWTLNVGKLTGLLHDKGFGQSDAMYQARIDDALIRFAGTDGFPSDSGFGHPFDLITYDVSAAFQVAGGSEAAGNAAGMVAMLAPAQTGPAGVVTVNGFGNGIAPLV